MRRSLLLLCLVACGEAPVEVAPPPPTVRVARFVADAVSGPRFVLEGRIEDDRVHVALAAHDAPPLFGFRVWLTHDGGLEELVTNEVLGAAALHATVEAPRGVSIGGTRRRRLDGDTTVNGVIAEATFALADAPARFALDGLVAKRADATDVALALGGARVEWVEEVVP